MPRSALERWMGCLISAHLMREDCFINARALGAAQHCVSLLEADSQAQLGPPSLVVAMAVLTIMLRQLVAKYAPEIEAEVQGLAAIADRPRLEKIEMASERVELWRAKSTFAKEGEEIRIRRSFYIHVFVPIGDPPNG